jgi:hypothetical protein
MSGVEGTRAVGVEAESGADADSAAGSAALVSAKDWVPGNTAKRLMTTAALAGEARWRMRAFIRDAVRGF